MNIRSTVVTNDCFVPLKYVMPNLFSMNYFHAVNIPAVAIFIQQAFSSFSKQNNNMN